MGDLMEHDARGSCEGELQKKSHGIGDGLALPIIVRGQKDLACFLGGLFQLLLDFGFLTQEGEAGFEVSVQANRVQGFF